MKILSKLALVTLVALPLWAQAIVQSTNCPKVLAPGSIVVAQSVSSLANYPIVILACYTLNSDNFSINSQTSPPTINVIGGNGGGGGTATDHFLITNNSGTVQQLGADCTSTVPCVARNRTAASTVVSPVTATLSGASTSGTAFWYFDNTLTLIVGHNTAATITPSAGLVVATNIVTFPSDSTPLWATTFTSNTWDTIVPSTMDYRTNILNFANLTGPGITINYNPITGGQTISTDPLTSPRYSTGSGAPSSTCTAGRDFYVDTSGLHLYFCGAVNMWYLATN